MKKQYIGIVRDHSGSMSSLTVAAKNDYNGLIDTLKSAADQYDIDTIVSTVKCGVGTHGDIEREIVNSSVNRLKPLTSYVADGGWTPLFDSVADVIDIMMKSPDANEPGVSFLVLVVTDGQDNRSRKFDGESLGNRIANLQRTDRWTFTFRVPRGERNALTHRGIPSGNIIEWDQTERGMRESSSITRSAVSNYYDNVSRGVRATSTFYTDASNVSKSQVKASMTNISSEVRIWTVEKKDANHLPAASSPNRGYHAEIGPFVEKKTRDLYVRGSAFYELVKPEKAVQASKMIVVRNRKDGSVFAGQSARDLLDLPTQGTIKLSPGDHGDWTIFIQSTSSNRQLPIGSQVLYWRSAAR